MDETIQLLLDEADEAMQKSLDHFEHELTKVRAGKASPTMLEGIRVEYYGAPTPLNQVSTVTAPEARTLVIQPFEKSVIANIERAIMEANLGFTPQNDGSVIRINIPMLTEERRKELVKQARGMAEDARVAIRNIRRDINDQLKKLKSEGVSEDEIKAGEQEVQKLTDAYTQKVENHMEVKEQEIMTV